MCKTSKQEVSKMVERNREKVRGEWGMPLAGGINASPVTQNMHPMEIHLAETACS